MILVFLLAFYAGCVNPINPNSSETPDNSPTPNSYLPQIIIDDVFYFLRVKPLYIEIPEHDYSGRITSAVGLSQRPTENGQANFDIEIGAPYAVYGNGIAVLWYDEWAFFVTEKDLLEGIVLLPPPFYDQTIDTATLFADYFVDMLNTERDLTGDEAAMDSWRCLFDFGQTPIYRSGLSALEYAENVFQFDVRGIKGETENNVTVLINLQGDEPFYFCSYTYYYPNARGAAMSYLELLADGDISRLAVWLGIDSGPEPLEEFIQQAEHGLSAYGSYDLHTAMIKDITFDNEARRFLCTVEDAQGNLFEISLSFGDGLIMPIRLN